MTAAARHMLSELVAEIDALKQKAEALLALNCLPNPTAPVSAAYLKNVELANANREKNRLRRAAKDAARKAA